MTHHVHGRRSASDKWPPSLPDQQETLVDKTFVFSADELIASTLVGRGSLLHKPGRLVTLKARSSDSDENTSGEASGGIRVVSTPGRFFGERDWTRSTVKCKQDHASLDADFDDHSGHNHRQRHRHRQVKKWLEDDEPRDDVPRRAKPGRRSLGHGRPVIGRVGDGDKRPRAPSGGSRYASSGTQTAGGSLSPPAGDRPALPGQTGGDKPGGVGSGGPSTSLPTTAPAGGSVQAPSGGLPPVTAGDPRSANPPVGPAAPGTIAGPAVPTPKPGVPVQSGPGPQQPSHAGDVATLPGAPPASSGQNIPPPASVPGVPAVQHPGDAPTLPVTAPVSGQPKALPPTSAPAGPAVTPITNPVVAPPASSEPKVLPPASAPSGSAVVPITNPATSAPGLPPPPQQLIPLKDQYMLAATGQSTQIRSATPGISAGTVPSDHIVFSTPDTGTQAFLTSSGPIVFETSLEAIKTNISDFPLSLSDPLRRDFGAAWKLDDNASYLQRADVNLKLGSDGKSLEMTGLKVKVSKDTKSAPLVFSTDAKVLNDEFETGFFQASKDAKITTLTGIDRYPGHLLLGLETSSANGGFENLADLCAVAHINPKPWLKILLKETAIKFGALAGTPARNAMWYIPGSGSKCCFRLEASLNLDGKLAGLLNKYLAGWNDHIPPLSVIAKRTVSPSSGPWGDASTIGELTIAAEPDINGEKRAMGMYVTIGEDHINVFFVCYSKALQWEALKAWIRKSCSEVGTAIDDLEKVLLNTGHGSKAQNTSTSHIYWRKVTVTLLNDGKGGVSLAGMRLELEASMQVLVPKDKHSVFTLDFIWTRGTGEFSGECEFSGIGNVLGKGDPPLQYYLDYERWDQFSYLDPSEPFMSLRHLDSSFVQNLPFGIPTEITEADLYVSNQSLSVSGRLEALIGRPTDTSVVSDPSKIPSLQIAHTMLGFSVNYVYASKEFNIMLDGSISLVPFKEGDPPPSLEAMITYSSQESQVSFSAHASNVPMTALHSLFAAGEEKTYAMSILESIDLQRIALDITASKGQPARVNFEADLRISSVLLATKFERTDVNTWKLSAELHKETTAAGQASKEFTLGDAVQKLLGQEVRDILPDFVTGTTFKTSKPDDKFDVIVTRLNGAKSHLVFGAELKFGMLHVQFAQLVPITGKTDKPSPIKRLIRVSLGPLPSISKLPILGNLDIPFDALEFLWVSTMFTPEDISTLNGSAKMFQEQPFKMRPEDKELSEGFHFRLVGSHGVFLDHVFGQDKQDKKKTPAGAATPGSKATPAPVQEKKPSTEAVVPSGGAPATTAPLAKKKGPLTLSGISLSYEGGVLRIHLDASVLIGPISAGIQGLTLVVRLDSKQIHGLHDILHVPIDVEVEGFDMSFARMPIQIAGALHHKPGTKAYFGGVAISLSTFSIAALGSYEQVPANAAAGTPEYDSFFIYAMMEGLIFTMGWAEVRGLMAGFGYNSRLRLPTVEQLSSFPLIQGFDQAGGFNMNQAVKSLTGPDAFVTPSMGSIWLALGLVIRACEAIDMRAVATVALGPNQTDIGLIARATATLPRRASPDKALVLIDLSVVGKLDLVNGELSVDGLINPTSFILNKDCRPSGGFAIRSWFGKNNPHSGDWVVSFGGYHPMYQVPAHYPRPQRLGISWTLSSNLRVTGNAYAAITPGAVMAGGMLQAVFSAGPLGAHFDAHADFLVNLKPLHYVADMAVSAGVYYEIRVWRFRKKISVNVGASLHLEGPPIHGSVHFDLSVVSFTVSFGSGSSEGKRAISLRELMELVLQEAGDTRKADNSIVNPHTFTAVSGLLGDDKKKSDTVNKASGNKVASAKERWHVRSDNFIFSVRSAVPANSIGIEGRGASQYTGNSIISRPMRMKKDTSESSKIKSTLGVKVRNVKEDKIVPFREVAKVEDQLPANYWGPYSENTADYMRPDRMPPTVSHLVGATLVPPPPAAPQQSIPVFKSMPLDHDAPPWRPEKVKKSVRYLDHANARDSVKWSRVKGAMGLEPEGKREKPPMDTILLTEAGEAKQAAAPGPLPTKPYRQGILDSFIRLAHSGTDAESLKVQKAYSGIGANVPDVILNDPQRFYIVRLFQQARFPAPWSDPPLSTPQVITAQLDTGSQERSLSELHSSLFFIIVNSGCTGRRKSFEYLSDPVDSKMGKSRVEDEVLSHLNGGKKRLQKKPRYETEGGSYWKEIPRIREIVDKSTWKSNGSLKVGETLKYDCFMPTGEVYEFLPCAPWPLKAREVLGYQRFRGTDRIMEIEGTPVAQDPFAPYKLLLYKGRYNADTGYDDRHRFVYLAENKPKEPAVGDCFIRLEEIHKRMNGTEAEYIEDCKRHNSWDAAVRAASPLSLSKLNKLQKLRAKEELTRATLDGKWTLRFRCWTVDGKECEESEKRLRNRLFNDVFPANDERDHIAVFKVWAELLRNSQGDKLGAKDFFGRYWDAVIPNDWDDVFRNGFQIILDPQWFQWFWGNVGDVELAYQDPVHRLAAKEKVFEGIKRAVEAPRLKFKPPLSVNNVFFGVELDHNATDCTAGWFEDGWRCLEGHPGGLYQIVVNLPVRLFLCLDTHKRPFWQKGYGHPREPKAKSLNDEHLDLCRPHTMPTTTLINTTLLNNPIKKRNPPQDRCVATNGYSANVAMSGAFPDFYPNAAIAKKKRVAETANNLVLGTPDTNTVMMRQAVPRGTPP
ncbi:uncharacterized protein FTJAE_2378 [Fusarium tjaetaba]|uniref:DUF6603 domain-containing protein n=1 Tax=Fusarium tjaetaba TaxID=1567544 RepID=A0A8H5W5E5_9HYPO|nr:uncharacterized protein FTJAE_2378 [Fusarium tjaetaba]KAF5645948.1 hypothetical protein FTJAE_2378 [Fusarium tjaetaba]